MLERYGTEEDLIQKMADAGCGEDMVAGVLKCIREGQKKEGLLLLQKQREILLDRIHKDRSCIEYLDDVLSGLRRDDLVPVLQLWKKPDIFW